MTELVNHPDHYKSSSGGEVIDIIELWGLGFCLGNALKSICRAGKKVGADRRTDLAKAVFYVERSIKNREYCGPGTYKVLAAAASPDGDVEPHGDLVAEEYGLTGNLEKAVIALHNYVLTFDSDYMIRKLAYISDELNGGKENE